MVNQHQKSQMFSDFDWVIKVVKSVKTKEQLSISLKCFLLWEDKHKNEISKLSHSKSSIRSSFWAIYKNKESQFSFVSSTVE